ncbi:hypothetical protein IWT25_00779 [Secundilactobacillus pentosiphilus]|uniref:Uncharacterized protein n=1 Tax=Secundilactobacillus pentosiphilus TaxID=1714682 RepID=A0A1Z5IUP5_9LACO|nr:hypothetical protein [Secundilactobacillus pentosiphilus]GAX05473.1 hypothetical protein IWT25_00779 [Secundilactobacillus pentosiphilus]
MTMLINGKEPDKIFIGDKQVLRKYLGDKMFYEYNPPSTGPTGYNLTREYQFISGDGKGFNYQVREISPNLGSWEGPFYSNNDEFPYLSPSNPDITNTEWMSN